MASKWATWRGSVFESRARRHFAARRSNRRSGKIGVGIEDAIPDRAEFLKVVGKVEFFREVGVPVARRHPAFLPIRPARIRFQFAQDLHMGQAVALAERAHGAGQIDANNDAADIKDHGARRFFDGRS